VAGSADASDCNTVFMRCQAECPRRTVKNINPKLKNIKLTIDKFNIIWYDGRKSDEEIRHKPQFLYVSFQEYGLKGTGQEESL
jgi:hypothetical protein